KQVSIEELNRRGANTLMEAIGIRFTGIGENFLEAEMPVDARTHQPRGILHGGASVALAETLGSVGAALAIDPGFRPVGLEINANHIRSVSSGTVIGRAEPIHMGRTTQIWEIRIRTPDEKLVCVSRLTLAILPPEEK